MNTNDTNNEILETEAAPEAEAAPAEPETAVEPGQSEEAAASETPAEESPSETEEAEESEELSEEDEFEEIYIRLPMPFWKKILIYCTVWLLLTVAACAAMWDMMEQYEEAQPWYAVEEYIESSVQSAFYTALMDAYPNVQNSYEPIYEIARSISAKYGDSLTYTKLIREYTYEKPVYLLQSEEQKLLKLTLEQGEETGFLKLRRYRVSSVELVASDMLVLNSYSLAFPKGAEVYITGKILSEETLAAASGFTVFGNTDFNACMLENFFERPTVRAIYKGTELTAQEGENFWFDYPEGKLHTLTITAPENAIVRISGKRVSDYFLTETAASEPDRFGATVAMRTYTVPTVSGTGIVSATLDGVILQIEEDGDRSTVLPITESCTVVLPKGAALYANDAIVDPASITQTDIPWVSAFDGVKNAPLADVYTLTDLYTLPEFTATLGDTALVSIRDGEQYIFVYPESETLKETYTRQTLDFMNAYLYYTTQGYSNTRANLNAAKAHVAYPSPLYTNLERSYIGYYYIAPQKMTVEYMQVESFIPFGEDAFTCELSYKINLKNWVGETTEENTMRIAFARGKNGFAPVNMLLVEE